MIGNDNQQPLLALGTLALSGTGNLVVTPPAGTNKMILTVFAKYAAVAGTSGLQVAVDVSPDGSSFSASNVATQTCKPAAGVLGNVEFEIGLSDLVTRKDGGTAEAYKLLFTNDDATNAVTYAVTAMFL